MRFFKHLAEWFRVGLEGSDYILFGFFLFGILFCIIFLFQKKRSNKLCRAEFIQSLIDKIRTDHEIQEFLYKISANEEWFDKKFYDTDLPGKVYNTLIFFNYICYLADTKVLPEREYVIFVSMFETMACNRSFQNYMFNLYHSKSTKKEEFPFFYLLDQCAEKMPGDFLNPESENYDKI